ncbi:MAG: IS256 family transposase [Armatimonadetes bacterium]|nr:IS256 family transposase [Armatimonadota bacterium]
MKEVYIEEFEEAIEAWSEVRGEDCVWGRYREFQLMGLKYFVERSLLDAVRWKLGVGWYERGEGRRGYRNGSYMRTLVTPYETVEVEVPRVREGSYEHKLWDSKGMLTSEAREVVLETYLSGASTRRVGEVLEKVLGHKVSAGTVSAICKGLDELVRRYWSSPLSDEWEYLLLDGVVVKNRSVIGTEKRHVLVAMGISVEGKKQILSFKQVESESEVCWESFLESLVRRGFEGKNLRLISTDGGAGVIGAVESVWPHVPRQRCWVHKLRNIANKVRKSNEKACLDGAKLIYLAPNRREAARRFRAWREKWIGIEPKAVACLEADIEELLEFFGVPEHYWKTMRTTNPIERVFREVRRRTRTISCFTNRRSVDRMLYAVLAHQNKTWDDAYQQNQFTLNP